MTDNTGNAYTDEELVFIRDNYATMKASEIAEKLGRRTKAIINLCYKRGWKKMEHWTIEEESALVNHFNFCKANGIELNIVEFAQHMGRCEANVYRKARSLGLTERGKRYVSNETKSKMGDIAKKRMQDNPHPRGFLGKKHSDSTKQRIGEISSNLNQSLTPGERSTRALKAVATRIKRYGTGRANVSNPYSRTKSGKRTDLNGLFVRSSWEANYARYLNVLIAQGLITRWEYESETFIFHGIKRGSRTYTPDFKIFTADGQIEYHEVKGWMDNVSKTRLKRMAKYYPKIRLILIGAK